MNKLNELKEKDIQEKFSFVELERELHIEELEERLEMTTGGPDNKPEPPKIPLP